MMFKKGQRDPLSRFSRSTIQTASTRVIIARAVLIGASSAAAQTISTVAGNGNATFSGEGGAATSAALNTPRGIAFDASGNLYIADSSNHRIRRVSSNGTITTFAGTGVGGFSGDGGQAANARLNRPEDVLVDAGGTLFIADSGNRRIRRVTAGGTISTVAGTGTDSYNGDNIQAATAHLNRPSSIAMDASGNLYIADSSNHRIRRVAANGTITTVAGNGVQGYSGEGTAATSASLRFPVGVTLDGAGNLYVADAGNHVVRRVTPGGIISTVAGNGVGAGTDTGSFSGDGDSAIFAGLNTPEDVAVDSAGNFFIADTANYRIRRVSGGSIATIAGIGLDGFSGDGGTAITATLNLPWSATLDASGNLLIGDMLNHRVRKITSVGGPPAAPGTGPGPGQGGGNPPTILTGGAVDAAGFRAAIAGGAIVALFGQNLANSTESATNFPLPTTLAGTSVTFNGTAAPLFYASPGQVNLQVPFNMSTGAATVRVTSNGVVSAPTSVTLSPFAPGVFTIPAGGTGAGAIVHTDTGVLVSATTRARPNEFLAIFCTGLGSVQPPVPSGSMGPFNPLSHTMASVAVTIGGISVPADYAGLAPGFAGPYQINVRVPAGVPSGSAVPLVVSVGGVTANTVTIAVQ